MNGRRGYTILPENSDDFTKLSPSDRKIAFSKLSPAQQKAILLNLGASLDGQKVLKEFLRSLLQDMIGNNIEINDELTPEQLKKILRTLAARLASFAIDPNNAIGGAIDKTDVGYHTFLRLWQVFSYVLANGTSSDANNDNSSFNQAMSNPAIAWSASLVTVIPIAFGAWLAFDQIEHNLEINSIPYQQKQLMKMFFNQKISPEDIDSLGLNEKDILPDYQDLVDRGKVVPRYLKIDKMTGQAIGSNKFANLIKTINGDDGYVNDNEGKFKKGARRVFGWVTNTWNFFANSALVFWPIWMAAVFIIGIAATYAFPALPIIIALTFGISIAIQAGMAYYRRRAKQKAAVLEQAVELDKKPEVIEAENKADANELAEMLRMPNELIQRRPVKKEHAFFKKLFHLGSKEAKKPEKSPYRVAALGEKQVIGVFKDPTVPTPNEAIMTEEREENDLDVHKQKIDKTLASDIGKHLLGSKAARNGRIAVTMVNTLIGQYTLSAFVLWLVGSALLVFAPAVAVIGTVAALVLGSILPGVSAAFSGIVGGIYSLKAFADSKVKQLEFEQTVYSKLSEKYTTTNEEFYKKLNEKLGVDFNFSLDNQPSKDVVFDYFAKEIEDKKARIKDKLRAEQQRIKKIPLDERKDKEQYILNYDLKKIDPYTIPEEKPSLWTRVKNAAFWAYKAVNAGQTWIFVVRSLFLAGAAIAGVCLLFGPGAGFAFIAIAATLAAVGIGFKLAHMYMEYKAEKKKCLVESLDAQISYLKKKDKQLSALSIDLGVTADDAPAPTDDRKFERQIPNLHSSLELKSESKLKKSKQLSQQHLDSSDPDEEATYMEVLTQTAPTQLPNYTKNGAIFFNQENAKAAVQRCAVEHTVNMDYKVNRAAAAA